MQYQPDKVKIVIVIAPRKPPAEFVYDPPKTPLDVVYHDEYIIVLNKPSGLLSVPGRRAEHADSLETRVQAEYPEARIVHRLDEATSGLLVMAMTKDAHRNIGLQFERRKTKKMYLARVWGHVGEDSGHVDLPLICDWPNRPLQMVDHERGRSSQTDWEVLERESGGATRMALYPITGRSHQLRVHMMEIGHPILGDEFYAHDDALAAEARLQLHAHKLMIYHPDGGAQTWFESPCPF
tara:strand:+ start:9752 stop:10465 length:714 start_codon:yes stop_codon:yes gene_type:complete